MTRNEALKILGLSDGASAGDIKAAYRALAKKYHPDLNPGDLSAEALFKQLNAAKTFLDDPQPQSSAKPKSNWWWKPGTGEARYERSSVVQNIYVSLEDIYMGSTVFLRVNVGGQIRDAYVKLERGAPEGSYTTIWSEPTGGVSLGTACVYSDPHELFKRSGFLDANLETAVSVSVMTLVLGGKVTVTLLDKSKIDVIIPPGTDIDAVLKVKERGFPIDNQHRGDLLVRVKPYTPKLSDIMIKNLKSVMGIE